jgi:hypothetical protein
VKLLVEELGLGLSYLEQKITVGDKPIQVEAIRPHLYKHLNAAGSLYLEIRNAAGTLLKTSDAVTIQSITDASGNYFHGVVRFYIKCGLLPNTTYRVRLVSTGYAFSESAYIGWCRGFDLGRYSAEFSPAIGASSALDMEIWEMKNVLKGEL